MLLAAGDESRDPGKPAFIAIAKPEQAGAAFQLAHKLRTAGVRAEMEQAGRSLKGQLKQADRVGAVVTVIVGDDIQVKDMDSGEQREAPSAEHALEMVREATGA
jgi:histidyl-tRNA synthetase